MVDAFFYEVFDEEVEAVESRVPPDMTVGFTGDTIQESGHDAPPAPVISIRTQSTIPTTWADGLKGLLSRSTGYNHIQDYMRTNRLSFPCGYLPLYSHRAIAEQALMLWMALLRRLPAQTDQFKTFRRDGLTGYECEGKTLLAVGVGNVGYEIIRIARGLGMHTLGVDIIQQHPDVTYVSIDEGLPQADIVVCAMATTVDNLGYFSYDRLKQARPGVIFVNIARGELSLSTDLLPLIDEKHLGGIGLDVYAQEGELAVSLRSGETSDYPQVKATLELATRPNVILTPHNAFNTHEAVARKAEHSIQQIQHLMDHGVFLWPVPEV